MNTTTIIFIVLSIVAYGVIIYLLKFFPQRVFISMKKQLLQSIEKENSFRWVHTKDNEETFSEHLWNYLQSRALRVLGHKRFQLFKIIFLQGGFAFMVWILISCWFFIPNDMNIIPFLPYYIFNYFMLVQIPIFFGFYFWHLKRFAKYMVLGEQEKFMDEVKAYLAKLQREAQDRFFDKYS